MDIRSKKSRPFLVWLSFYMGVIILLLYGIWLTAHWSDVNESSEEIKTVMTGDFKEFSTFKDTVGDLFRELANEVLKEKKTVPGSANTLFDLQNEGANLIYYAKNLKTGRIVANKEMGDLSAWEKESVRLPDGYDFYIYFNGEEFIGRKGSQAINLYGNNSGYWNSLVFYLRGNDYPQSQQFSDMRILLLVKKDINENLYGTSRLHRLKTDFRYAGMAVYGIIAVFLAGVALVVLSFIKRKSRRVFEEKLARVTGWVWLEVKVILSIIVWMILLRLLSGGTLAHFSFEPPVVFAAVVLFNWFYLVYADFWFNRKRVFTNNIIHSVIKLYKSLESVKPFQKYMLQRMYLLILVEVIAVALIIFLYAVAVTSYDYGSQIRCLILMLLVAGAGVYFLYRYIRKYKNTVMDMGHLIDQITAVKSGDMASKHSIGPGADLYGAQESLNLIKHGMNKAVEERTRSERMKAELVTNVSHDLKTPLTSIISYVDLLSKEEGLPAHVTDYISILSQKSERLKTLIQDLFELSKVASGEIRLDIEKLDLAKLLRQTLADMDEQIVQSGLMMKVNIPEEPVYILSDGSKLYRVFQNLYANALKYSMAGSRVYTDLQLTKREVCVVIKNTSAHEMDFSEDEILERFVRGDQARSTEGSGLGLAIAQSFAQACGGKLQIKLDGDLFKVIVTFPAVPADVQGEP